MIASTTKYTLNRFPAFFAFAVLSLKSIGQAHQTQGLITIQIRCRDLRTLTVWQTSEDMKAFRNSGRHLQAMTDSPRLGSNQSYSWQTDYIPSWQEAIAKLNASLS